MEVVVGTGHTLVLGKRIILIMVIGMLLEMTINRNYAGSAIMKYLYRKKGNNLSPISGKGVPGYPNGNRNNTNCLL